MDPSAVFDRCFYYVTNRYHDTHREMANATISRAIGSYFFIVYNRLGQKLFFHYKGDKYD